MNSKVYDNLYKEDEVFWQGEPGDWFQKHADKLGSNVLDLGAGDGKYATWIAEQGVNVTAVDNNPTCLRTLKGRVNDSCTGTIHTSEALAHEYIEASGSIGDYDSILMMNVLQFYDREEIIRLLEELKRKTKPGACHFIDVFVKEDSSSRDNVIGGYSFLPGELPGFYQEWEIEYAAESDGKKKNGAPQLIARKPEVK